MTKEEEARTLREAAAILRKYGWLHGPFIWGARNAVVQRMLDLPHAGDNDYQ